MKRKKTALISLALGAALLAILALARWPRTSPEETPPASATPRARPAPDALTVFVHRIEPRVLAETITANGTLRAHEAVELRSEITGRVVELHFEEGRAVQEGEVLLRINDAELQAQLRQVLTRIELARVQEQRQRQLFETQSTSREALDESINESRVLQAEADLIRAQLAKTEVRAPFSGIIGLRYVSLGAYVGPTTPIGTLTNLDQLKIDFSISERHMDRVRPGTAIRFRVAGRPEAYDGRVYAIEPAIDVSTRTILLRAQAENPERRLLPGAYASVEVQLERIEGALMVPTPALAPGATERIVYVVEDGTAQPRRVETGIRLSREIQIVSGLEPGALVITSGLLQLRPGMPVKPVSDEGAALSATGGPPGP